MQENKNHTENEDILSIAMHLAKIENLLLRQQQAIVFLYGLVEEGEMKELIKAKVEGILNGPIPITSSEYQAEEDGTDYQEQAEADGAEPNNQEYKGDSQGSTPEEPVQESSESEESEYADKEEYRPASPFRHKAKEAHEEQQVEETPAEETAEQEEASREPEPEEAVDDTPQETPLEEKEIDGPSKMFYQMMYECKKDCNVENEILKDYSPEALEELKGQLRILAKSGDIYVGLYLFICYMAESGEYLRPEVINGFLVGYQGIAFSKKIPMDRLPTDIDGKKVISYIQRLEELGLVVVENNFDVIRLTTTGCGFCKYVLKMDNIAVVRSKYT